MIGSKIRRPFPGSCVSSVQEGIVCMTKDRQFKTVVIAALMGLVWTGGKASAAQCGSTAAGFEVWKRQFADEARGKGVSASTVAALMGTNYATATIAADRNQGSMH